jgi:UDP-N-acetylglucosamine--N-acetylmuramyl-(pentapeptide) pyrophosphoryl-undecaprenol N-acetylglucosamine transferase
MRILAATGASGGHIFPAVSFLEAVREKQPEAEMLLILPEGAVKDAIDFGGLPVRAIPMTGIRPGMGKDTVVSIWRFLLAFARSLDILLTFKPDIVVGFGSLASIPVLLVSWLLRIPIVLHEQNVVPGKANRFLSRITDRVAVSFEESQILFPSRRRIVVTGNPLRKQMRRIPPDEARRALGMSPGIFTVLVTGGSQGSDTINKRFIEACRSFPRNRELQVIHITGPSRYDAVSSGYAGSGITVKTFSFLKQMELAYSAADVSICRAGATTCAELMFYALPALIVPYPFAHGHQMFNAAALERKGCAVVIRDQDFSSNNVREFIERCVTDPLFISRLRAAYEPLERDAAARRLAGMCLETEC